jgi:colanic acid biosynthesis glycosyl transferase WcaI
MKILILAQHYAPEEVSGAVLATQLATDLAVRGHQVSFVTSAPSYPQGCVFPGYRNRLFFRETISGVKVIRVWSYIHPQKTFWRRLLNYGTFSAAAVWGGLFAGKPDVILSASPPFPLGIAAWLIKSVWGVPWVLRVEDLYPDVAIAMGALKNRWGIAFFKSLEKWLYQKSDHISVISIGFLSILKKKGVAEHKISVIPVWADPDIIQPLPKVNDFSKQYGLEEKFVVLYSGNLGLTSALDEVIDAAKLLEDQKRVVFLIIGEGVFKARLAKRAQQENLNNVIFLPFQPLHDVPIILATADFSLVTLNQNSSDTSLPMKTFSIMASGRPILAVAPGRSELAALVREADCGQVVEPGESEKLANTIVEFIDRPQRMVEMGQNGRKRLLADFSRDHCIRLYETLLSGILS